MALEVYYTGSDTVGAPQSQPDLSLGGYMSGTQVPNDFFGNLFPTISQLSVQDKVTETRVIAVKNNTGGTLTSFSAYISIDDVDNCETEWEIGYYVPTLDECADLVVEKISSKYASPMNVTFQDAVGVNNKLSIPNLADQSWVGIYLKRTVSPSSLDEETLLNNFEEGIEPPQKEEIDLVFSWA